MNRSVRGPCGKPCVGSECPDFAGQCVPMQVACCECTLIYATKPSVNGGVSHGYCAVCGPRLIKTIQQRDFLFDNNSVSL